MVQAEGRPDGALQGRRLLPVVVVLEPVIDVMRRESRRCPVETGGILVGRWVDSGRVLIITHAAGPGKHADHGAYRFRPDVDYQQRVLDQLHGLYGVDYVGEWHKHPGGVREPSGWDVAELGVLLREPGREGSDLAFPIVTCDEEGFEIHPFMVREGPDGVEITPVEWERAGISLGEELNLARARQRASAVYEATREVAKTTALATLTVDEPIAVQDEQRPSLPSRVVHGLGRGLMFAGRKLLGRGEIEDPAEPVVETQVRRPEILQPCQEGESVTVIEPPAEAAGGARLSAPWYASREGRRRLAREARLLDGLQLRWQAHVMEGGQLSISFPRGGGRELIAVLPSDYPASAPSLFVRRRRPEGRGLEPVESPAEWGINAWLGDVICAALGPDLSIGAGGNGARDRKNERWSS